MVEILLKNVDDGAGAARQSGESTMAGDALDGGPIGRFSKEDHGGPIRGDGYADIRWLLFVVGRW